jgi:hypothetical protein
MTPAAPPTAPAENWQAIRDEWIAAVEGLVADAEAWSKTQGWATRRDPKTIAEDPLGAYLVPRLLIHGVDGRLLLDPVTRFVVGGLGLVDFCVLPSYDWVKIVRTPAGWEFHPAQPDVPHRAWSEGAFVEVARELLATGR